MKERDTFLEQIVLKLTEIFSERAPDVIKSEGLSRKGNLKLAQAYWLDADKKELKIEFNMSPALGQDPCVITFMDLWQISEALGTTDINFHPGARHSGWSEHTPSWFEDGALYIKNPKI